jgi:hypothetical protein
LETSYFRNKFDRTIVSLIKKHKIASENLANSDTEECARQYINWSNILLRYGCFENILNNAPEQYEGITSLEVNLIQEMAKTELLLSQDKPINIDFQLNLADKYLFDKDTTDREKIILLNKIVVNYYRHQKKSNQHESQ